MNGRRSITVASMVVACAVALTTIAGCGARADSDDVGPADVTAAPIVAAAAPSSAAAAPAATTTVVAPPPAPQVTEPLLGAAPASTTTVVAAAPVVVAPVRSGVNVNASAAVGDPVRVVVPSAGIDGTVSSAGVLDDGTVAVPVDPSVAGWFTGGPRPGEIGPAVIVGHVDSKKFGPGVFFRLAEVKVGDLVTVETTTGSQQFVTVATERVPKDEFPTARVYGPAPTAALRLITCGGSFDRSIGHYRDNIVVYLEKVAV